MYNSCMDLSEFTESLLAQVNLTLQIDLHWIDHEPGDFLVNILKVARVDRNFPPRAPKTRIPLSRHPYLEDSERVGRKSFTGLCAVQNTPAECTQDV